MLEPAKTIIDICGGPEAVASMVGVHRTNVYRWTYPEDRGGTNGLIPTRQQAKLLTAARDRGIDLRPEHFFGTGAQS
jgi:hypothetical protein